MPLKEELFMISLRNKFLLKVLYAFVQHATSKGFTYRRAALGLKILTASYMFQLKRFFFHSTPKP